MTTSFLSNPHHLLFRNSIIITIFCCLTESVALLSSSSITTGKTTTTTTIGQQPYYHDDPFLILRSHHRHHHRRRNSSGRRRHHYYFNSVDPERLPSSSSQLSAGLKGTDKEQDSSDNTRKNEISPLTNNSNDNKNTPVGLPFPLPSISQVLSIWVVGISANRVMQSLRMATTGNDNNKLVLNIALNAIILIGASIYLLKSIQGIDYSSLEDLDQNSLAKQAGSWALDGTIPTNFEVTTDDNNNTKKLYEVCSFGGGCFWGTELYFQRIPGVIATCVGYTQGSVDKPNYEQVCSGTTGHTEGIQLIYDPSVCSYERLLNQLFDTINPTLVNQVGNDRGSQYRHGVYYHTDEQYNVASNVFQSIRAKYDGKGEIVTELKPATIFWPAENYHQRYLEKGGQSAAKKCEEKVRCYG